MTLARAAVPVVSLLVGCSLIDLDDLSEGSGGVAGTTGPGLSTMSSGTATSSKSTGSAATTGVATGTAATNASSSDGASSSSSGGCDGPTFCAGSTAEFCDDFDSDDSKSHWNQIDTVGGQDAELSFVDAPFFSCPTSAKAALFTSAGVNNYVQWEQYYDPPGGSFGSFRVRFWSMKDEVVTDAEISLRAIWEAEPGVYCEVLVYDSGNGVGVFAQRFDDVGAVYLTDDYAGTPTPTLDTWVHHDITIDPGAGAFTITYSIEHDEGAGLVTTVVDPPIAMDAICGADAYPTDMTIGLGSHYGGVGPNVMYFDDVEFDFDP